MCLCHSLRSARVQGCVEAGGAAQSKGLIRNQQKSFGDMGKGDIEYGKLEWNSGLLFSMPHESLHISPGSSFTGKLPR